MKKRCVTPTYVQVAKAIQVVQSKNAQNGELALQRAEQKRLARNNSQGGEDEDDSDDDDDMDDSESDDSGAGELHPDTAAEIAAGTTAPTLNSSLLGMYNKGTAVSAPVKVPEAVVAVPSSSNMEQLMVDDVEGRPSSGDKGVTTATKAPAPTVAATTDTRPSQPPQGGAEGGGDADGQGQAGTSGREKRMRESTGDGRKAGGVKKARGTNKSTRSGKGGGDGGDGGDVGDGSSNRTPLPVRYRDLGGIEDILADIKELVEYPLAHPEVYRWLGVDPPRGVLLHGPPGCGKTALANAIANECGVPFFRIAATEIVSGMSGESEAKVGLLGRIMCMKVLITYVIISYAH